LARKNNRRVDLPDLDTSIGDIVDAERVVRKKVSWHSDIYDGVSKAIRDYKKKEREEKGSGNDSNLQKALYFGVYNAMMGLLHDKKEGEEGLAEFRRDIPKYRDTIDERLAYVGALVVSATVSTRGYDSIGFSNRDVADWKKAACLISKACALYPKKGIKRTGQDVQGRLDAAFEFVDRLRQKAFDIYDEGIPE